MARFGKAPKHFRMVTIKRGKVAEHKYQKRGRPPNVRWVNIQVKSERKIVHEQ